MKRIYGNRRGRGGINPYPLRYSASFASFASSAVPVSRASGFTLIELLTVIAIISVLAGLTYGSISVARRFADQKATQQEILNLVAAANSYNNSAWGDYPAGSLAAFKLKGNGVNEGNEALVLALSGRKKGGPFHEPFSETRLENGDADQIAARDLQTLKTDLDLPQSTPHLYEYIDIWGNPFVYIHNRDYGTKAKVKYTSRPREAAVAVQVEVLAAKSAKLGTFQAPTSFQIWSFGPNGKNENGEGDDIASWK